MTIKIKRKTLGHGIVGVMALFIIASILVGVSFKTSYVIGATNITNNTVIAIVNVTNTEPNVTSVTVGDGILSPIGEIDLTASGVTVVTCNASIFEYNGVGDINENKTNGTFYIQSIGPDATPDNNHLYRNESCGSCTEVSATNVSCDCRFAVQYYANDSSTWQCNISVKDKGGTQKSGSEINLTSSGVSGLVTVTKLLAINTTTLLDYGNLSVTETSAQIVHNVTNVGNINLNLSLRGYGGTNETIGENLTMMCDFGNISIGQQRYSLGLDSETPFAGMNFLRNQTTISNLTFPAKVNDIAVGWERNSSFWRLQVPLSVGGICNGTIIFGAVDAET